MSDEDFRDLLYVVRALMRHGELNYHSYRYGIELQAARDKLIRLCPAYLGHEYYDQEEDRWGPSGEKKP